MASVTIHLHIGRHMPRTSPLCNYFVFFKYITNSRCLSTLFSALCCFGAQFTILSFSPPALRGAKRRTMYPPASCALFSHREGHIVRPPTYNPNNTLGIKLPRLANTFFCLSIPPKKQPGPIVNCTPFVRQYDILSNKWGVLLCQKEYQTSDIRQNSKNW